MIDQPFTSLHIDNAPLPWELTNPQAFVSASHGAVNTFIGVVRDEHQGKAVSGIEYQCHAALALSVLKDLCVQLRNDHGNDLALLIHHGTGWMVPGDIAVIIHAVSGHRAAAFAACRDAIEYLKKDLPVWKHEHYSDHSTAWLPGS